MHRSTFSPLQDANPTPSFGGFGLRMTNEKIILRHVAAVALSSFFKHGRNGERFEYVQTLVGDWGSPKAVSDLKLFCVNNQALKDSLRRIVPPELGDLILGNDAWIEGIAGSDSRFARAEIEVCADHRRIQEIIEELVRTRPTGWDRKTGQLERRAKTIAGERALAFLSRKAIIPKYGFPVDVVELDTRPQRRDSMGVSLQRDLSQAIAEYAPGGKVVANKKEWESCGVKTIPGKEFRVTHYSYDSARNFRQWNEIESPSPQLRKYLEPVFGFVTPLFEEPKVPRGRARCLYTTRPFFPGFPGFEVSPPETETLPGVTVTQARPGRLIILCEGRNQKGFYICRVCGRHMTDPQGAHKTPEESECNGTLDQFSLGHELETDLVRIRFSQLADEWDAYSLAYAVLLA